MENNRIPIRIQMAEPEDCEAILALQYLAFQKEAESLQNFEIQPLTQTLEEVQKEYRNGLCLKAMAKNGRLVGSIRSREDGDSLYIGKLIVHPAYQRQGIGRTLMEELEQRCPKLRYTLFTRKQNAQNLRFYQSLGYRPYREEPVSPNLTFVYLEKRKVPSHCGNSI